MLQDHLDELNKVMGYNSSNLELIIEHYTEEHQFIIPSYEIAKNSLGCFDENGREAYRNEDIRTVVYLTEVKKGVCF